MSPPVIKAFYWLPYCSTCVKAQQYLLDRGVTIEKYINVKEESVGKARLKELSTLVGGVGALFSKRAMKYRAMGLHEIELSEDDMLAHMAQEYTFIKRPVIVTDDDRALAGFSAKQYDALIKNN